MRLKTLILAAAVAAIAQAAPAQIVARVDPASGGCVYAYDAPDTDADTIARAQARWGSDGQRILASNRTGAGALYGVTDGRSGTTRFFFVHGFAAVDDAAHAAQAKAEAYARGLGPAGTLFSCGTWFDMGRYKLKGPPTAGEK